MEPYPHPAALAAAVASEFNDELTLLLNELSLTQESLGRGHPAGRRLVAARHAALRCTAIAANLLEFTRRSGLSGRTPPLERLLARGAPNSS
jgi:hypothetical protein